MFPDIRFEADVLRAALLLGLVREREVPSWADALLATEADAAALLADVALARPELTAMREALRPLAEPTNEPAVGAAMLAFIARDPAAASLSTADKIRVLSHLRREVVLPDSVSVDIKLFEDRFMLATAGVGTEQLPSHEEIALWLKRVCSPSYYRVSIARGDELAAFLGALSRKIVRDRRWERAADSSAARAWIVHSSDEGGTSSLVLSETLWQTAIREFSPLPLASRLPYAGVPNEAEPILEENTAVPMGVVNASSLLGVE